MGRKDYKGCCRGSAKGVPLREDELPNAGASEIVRLALRVGVAVASAIRLDA